MYRRWFNFSRIIAIGKKLQQKNLKKLLTQTPKHGIIKKHQVKTKRAKIITQKKLKKIKKNVDKKTKPCYYK